MPRPRPKTRMPACLGLLAALAAAGASGAGVNELRGRIGFSNTNPEILQILGAPGNAGLSTLRITATSQPPASFSVHDASPSPTNPAASDWSLQVAADAAGTTYRVAASAQLGAGTLKDDYYFLTVTSPPVIEEPAPDTTLDILECAGVIRILYLDESGTPVMVQGDRVTADSSLGGVSPLGVVPVESMTKDLVVRGDGSTYTVRAEITYGTDPFVDRITQLRTTTVVVGCDEIVELPVTVTTPGSAQLATIHGRLDILGEDEIVSAGSTANVRSRVQGSGPLRNLRADAIPGPPSEGAWSLDNLLPSTVVNPAIPYVVDAEIAFGSGQAFASFRTPSLGVTVDAGEVADIDDAFVLDPVVISGSVLLAGPPPDPVVGSPLQDLWRASDRDANRDGIPDDLARLFDSTIVTGRGRGGVAPGATRSALGAIGEAIVGGAYDAVSASVTGDYRLVLGNLDSEPGYYEADELNLKLLDTVTPTVPDSYIDQRVDIDDPGPQWELPAGATETRDRAYCFSRVIVGIVSPSDPFYAPDVTGVGSFSGTDFLGMPGAYDGTLWWGRGTPNSVGRAAMTGQSVLLLPEGTWTLEPLIRIPVAGGPTSTVRLPAFIVDVGCRQSIVLVPEVQVVVDSEVPSCATGPTLRVAGRAHADDGIESLSWSVNGGTPQVECTACGTDRAFAFDVTLVPGDNAVLIEAVDPSGRRAATELDVRVASEPSARDLRPGVTPFRVWKDPAGLYAQWQSSARDMFALHAGTLASLRAGVYDHAQVGGCDIAQDWSVIASPAGDAYFLVTGGCGLAASSYGRDSFGVERPRSPNECR